MGGGGVGGGELHSEQRGGKGARTERGGVVEWRKLRVMWGGATPGQGKRREGEARTLGQWLMCC